MKWSKLPWGWILAMVYVAALPIAVTAILHSQQLAWLPPRTSADVAAWVQAVGSVIAIGISIFWALRLQDRERTKTAQLARLHWLQAVHGIATSCMELVEHQYDAFDGRVVTASEYQEHARPNRLATVHSAIAALDLQRAHPSELALNIIELQHVTSKVLRRIKAAGPTAEKLLDAKSNDALIQIDIGDCLARAADAFQVIDGALNQATTEYQA